MPRRLNRPDIVRFCNGCRRVKPSGAFYAHRRVCKSCYAIANHETYLRRKDDPVYKQQIAEAKSRYYFKKKGATE